MVEFRLESVPDMNCDALASEPKGEVRLNKNDDSVCLVCVLIVITQ